MNDILNPEDMYLDTTFRLSCPEGFHVMDEEESSNLNLLEGGSFIGFTDPERHIIVTIGWKKTGGILSLMLKTKDLAEKMEKIIGKAMKDIGFQSEGHLERTIAGCKAEGFSYLYTAQEIRMLGQSYVVKEDKRVFYFHFYSRAELREENLKIWSEILDSVTKQ